MAAKLKKTRPADKPNLGLGLGLREDSAGGSPN